MIEEIPKPIKTEFKLTSENIKYPTYLDEEFEKAISEEEKLDNYSEENTKKIFDEFFDKYESCKKKYFEITSENLHSFQEYCLNINEKSINYVFYFYIFEKFFELLKDKYYKKDTKQKKEIFCDEIIYGSIKINKNFDTIYKNEYNNQNELNKISHLFNPVIDKYNKILRSKNEIGNVLIRTLKYLTKYLLIPFEEELNKYLQIKIFFENNYFKSNKNEENEIILLNIILYLKKIKILEYAFYNSALVDINDICNLNENSKEWIELKKILIRIIPNNSEELKNQIIERRKSPDIFTACISNISLDNIDESISASSLIFSGTKNYLYYKAYENKAKIDSKKFQIKITVEDFSKYFKLFKTFKPIFTKFLPSVNFRRKIYIKKELPNINRSYIERLINFIKGEDNPVDSSKTDIEKNNNELPLIYKDKIPDKTIKRNYVSVTILNNKKLFFKDEQEESLYSYVINKFTTNKKNIQINNEFKKNTIIIAVHGGGFIFSSVLLHERYLRKWVKEIDIPIFGINYSLAPKYRYPEGVNDIYQAYMWILTHAKDELNMDIKHIILYGDSAGANMIFSLNTLLIVLKEYDTNLKEKIILPELLLPFYPVTHVSLNNYSNSLLLTLGEQMLNPDILKYMCKQYLDEYYLQEKDFILNPILLDDYILEKMTNKIRMFFGTNDILRDDAIKLLYVFSKYNNKKGKNKIDVRGYDILYLGHGFNGHNEEIQKISRNVFIPEIEEFLKNIS